MTSIRLIYVTVGSVEKAEQLARTLLERHLIACANILPGMRSIYHWKGEIEAADEAVLLLKTTEANVAEAIEAVEELHEYETPCALELKVESGSAGYLEWLMNETISDQ